MAIATTTLPITVYKDGTSPTVASGAGSSTTTTPPTTTPPPTSGDTTAPTVAITSPTSGVWTGNSINVSVSGTDNVKLASIQVYGDGTLFATVPCSAATCTGTVTWLTGGLASGQHKVTAVATDTSGNTTTSAAVTINK